MPQPVISVRGLGKKYRLGATLGHDTLRDRIAQGCGDLLRRLRGAVASHQSSVISNQSSVSSDQSAVGPKSLGTELPQTSRSETGPTSPVQHSAFDIQHSPARAGAPRPDEFWALRDVSFDVHQGEVVGIIGRNGAGKSTLLKILSQITEPTTGEVVIRGRVASLLEVGTGFHPELTGRENVFLNGAILGMSQAEIRRKFDEIVAFAEVEKFLDTPVKRYSSGMYVRLAFAVAAHLEPEILIVDEVLAVGDAAFQRKCLGKMQDVAGTGRTVLFVSHSMPSVLSLCGRGFLVKDGSVVSSGPVADVVASYFTNVQATSSASLRTRDDRVGSGWLRFVAVHFLDRLGRELKSLVSGQPVRIRFRYEASKELPVAEVLVAFNVRNTNDQILTNLNSQDCGCSSLTIHRHGYFDCVWDDFNLRSGLYRCNVFCSVNGETVDWLQYAFDMRVDDGDFFGHGKLVARDQGDILTRHSWSSGPVTTG